MPLGVVVLLAASLVVSGCQRQPATVTVNVADEPASPSPVGQTNGGQSDPVATSTGSSEIGDEAVDDKPTTVQVPAKLVLPVVFAQQAPFANWDELHQEACEEASIIMADRYFHGKPLDETVMESEIQKLVAWEEENGYKVDLTAEEAVYILQNVFGLSAKVSEEVTVDRIKYELSKGNLVIVPAAGRELGNPNFKQPGPIYHMLVIKGYDGKQFITNDPGTRKGDGWRYDYDTLIAAVHDWDHGLAEGGMTDEEMASGRRVMVIVSK